MSLNALKSTVEITFWLLLLAALGLPSASLSSQRGDTNPVAFFSGNTVQDSMTQEPVGGAMDRNSSVVDLIPTYALPD